MRGFGDLPEYESPIDGKIVRGRRQRRNDLERSGCRPYEGFDQESKEAARVRSERQQKIDTKVDESIERTLSEFEASNRLTRVGERSDQPYPKENARTY